MTVRIDVEELNAYYGDFLAVEGASISVAPLTVTAFIGPSGCGKSTVRRTPNRMHEAIPGGRITGIIGSDGRDLYAPGVDPVNVRRAIGMVFQQPNPFPTMTVYGNVAAGYTLAGIGKSRNNMDGIVESCLTRTNLWNEVKDRLKGPGAALSGGQQQRLCIAGPELISDLEASYTIVIVTHNMPTSRAYQRPHRVFNLVGVGQPGRLVEYADTSTIFSSPRQQSTEDHVSGRIG